MRHRVRWPAAFAVLLVGAGARADFQRPQAGEVAVRDMPGSGRTWQEARSIISAPPDTVRRWLTEYEFWPGRFRDVTAMRVLDRRGPKTRFVMRSRIMERELLLDAHTDERGVYYQADDGDVQAVGRIFITPTGDGRTDVIMQTHARVGGLLGMVAPSSLVRSASARSWPPTCATSTGWRSSAASAPSRDYLQEPFVQVSGAQQPEVFWHEPPAGEQTQLTPLRRFEQQAAATPPPPSMSSADLPLARQAQRPITSTSSEQQAHGLAGFPVATPSVRQTHLPPTDWPEQQPIGLPLSP